MAVSAVGQRISVTALRQALATVLVFVALFFYLYGPPLTAKMREAAHNRCNELTGDTYRSYRLEWKTTTYKDINVPHWLCVDLTKPQRPATSLGWWVDL